ncbi:MAG: DUF4149 domain-containing protein [Gammaproteobacteria bacterium]|nr:DUF4149 domain-containing protein [Gammaproteobacteria bacterium]
MMGRTQQAVARIAAALWAGGLWAIGYAVAPLLFARLPLALAGGLAGRLFAIWQGLGLLFGGIVFVSVRHRARPWPVLASLAWALDAGFELILLPVMASLKGPHFGPASPHWHVFLILHGVAAACYLVEGLLVLALVAGGVVKTNGTQLVDG